MKNSPQLTKENLRHGSYYQGESKHTSFARWNSKLNLFLYVHKFEIKEIKHMFDTYQTNEDGFLPQNEVKPLCEHLICDLVFEAWK